MPTIQELYNNISEDLRLKLGLSGDLKTVLDTMALSLAGQFYLSYLAISDVEKNMFADTAEGLSLERIGRIHLGRNKLPATGSVLTLTVTGSSGSVLRSGITFKSNDDALNPGQLYILESGYTLSSGVNTIEVRSLGSGVVTNLVIGNSLTITEPVIGVDQVVYVSGVITSGVSAETDEVYRSLVLNSIRLEPQGGSRSDYRLWASDVLGVRKVYPYVRSGSAGFVDVYVESVSGVPDAPILSEVESVLNAKAPIQATVTAFPIVQDPVDVVVSGLSIDTPSIRNSIEANIESYLSTVRPFIGGSDLVSEKNDILYTAKLQGVVTDVLDSGNFFTDFQMLVNGVDQLSYLFSGGNTPVLRNLTFS